MARSAAVEKVQDATKRAQFEAELALVDKMSTTKSAEEKKIENLLSATSDQELRSVLQNKLDSIRSESGIDVEDAIDEIRELDLDPINILQKGLSKDVNSRAHAQVKREQGDTEDE